MMRTMNPLGRATSKRCAPGWRHRYTRSRPVWWEAVDADGVPWWNVPTTAWRTDDRLLPRGRLRHRLRRRAPRPLLESCSGDPRSGALRRLSTGPGTSIPGERDALGAYRWAVAQGADPRRRRSAGIRPGRSDGRDADRAARGRDVLPAAGLCLSPWLDLTGSNPRIEVAPIDPMLADGARGLREGLPGGGRPEVADGQLGLADLSGLPPLLIQAGTAEILIGEIEAFAKKASFRRGRRAQDLGRHAPRLADLRGHAARRSPGAHRHREVRRGAALRARRLGIPA